jgi:curved DNA-binding protein CbpA
MPLNLYEILEVKPDASQEEIKKAYRRLVRLYHPDSGTPPNSDKSFHEIQEAYEVLGDIEKRKTFDDKEGYSGWRRESIDAYQRAQAHAKENHIRTEVIDEKQERSWSNLQSEARDGDELSGLNAYRFGNQKKRKKAESFAASDKKDSAAEPKSNFFRKASNTLFESIRGLVDSEDKTTSKPKKPVNSSPRRGIRSYRFTIDALESVQGTYREVVLDEDNGPRVIRVKIPANTTDGSSLKVNCPQTSVHPARTLKVKIEIEPHDFVEREGIDLTVKIPITLGEALRGAELEVPTMEGPIRIRIPEGWTDRKKLRVRGRGVEDEENSRKGDLFVQTLTVAPDEINDAARRAADALDECYYRDVRANVPKSLVPRKKNSPPK